MRVGVVGIPGRWSSERLADAVAERTGERILIDMRHVVLDLAAGTMRHRGLDLRELDGIVVKKIAHAYSPDVLDRMELLRYLKGLGVRIFSDPERMLGLLDRLSGTLTLRLAGIPMPDTFVTESVPEAIAAVRSFGKAVAKPLFTSKARGMFVLDAKDDVERRLQQFKDGGNPLMYLQRLVDFQAGRDLGVAFLGGEYLATYARVRRRGSWSTTTASGGRYERAEPSDEVLDVARRAQAVFGLDFTCVDVVESKDGPLVFEVSAFGGFRGLQDACEIDAAALYAEHVVGRLRDG